MTGLGVVPREQAKDPLVLAIDVGTSSARAFVYDAGGRMVAGWGARQPYSAHTTGDGGVEIDGDALADLTKRCVGETLAAMGPEVERLIAVGCDTFWHSLIGVERDHSAATPVYTWADTRSARAAGELRARVDAEAVHQRTGAVIHSSYLPAKLLWLRQSRPDLVKSVAYWMSFGEYLYLRLFGERRVSVSMASGTGLFDQRACTWDAEMLDVVGIKESSLSPVAEFSEAMNGPRGIVGSAWEHVREIPWYLAVGDGAANNLGSGGDRPETWVLMVGTSGALRVVRNVEPGTIPPGLWSYRVDRRRIIQGGALSSGGNVFAWLSQSLQLPGPEQVEAELAAMEPDAHGLTILPFLAGERSPGWKADAHGAFAGVSLATRPLEIVRASLESIAYRFALVYDLLQSDVGAPRSIIGSGAGLLDSPTWMQIMADVLGGPLVASAALEASARGAALLALEAAGAIQDSTEVAAPLGIEYAPVAGHARIYRAAMERQNVLYRKVVQ